MNINKITYIYDKKTFRKIMLRHLRPLTIPYFCFFILTFIFVPMLVPAYLNNNKIILLTMGIPYIIIFFGGLSWIGYYRWYSYNLLININNWSYQHELIIENNNAILFLKSLDGLKEEKYSFPIKKIKKEKDTYLIFKDHNHFLYVPAELFDANKY